MSETELDKIKVLLVGQNKNINIIKRPIEENKVIIKKDKTEPFFDADSIFQVKEVSTAPIIGKLLTKRRKREPCIIQVLGKPKAEKLTSKKDLFEPLTNVERKDIVKREIAKTLKKFQPITPIMFVVLFLLIIINIILTIIMLSGGRIAI